MRFLTIYAMDDKGEPFEKMINIDRIESIWNDGMGGCVIQLIGMRQEDFIITAESFDQISKLLA